MFKSAIIYFILFILFASCNKDKTELEITDFSKSHTVILEPYKFYPYSTLNVWVEGYSNDTILIKLHNKKNTPILKLQGKFKERWHTDYYGEGSRTFIFEPYKATKGKVKIQYSL